MASELLPLVIVGPGRLGRSVAQRLKQRVQPVCLVGRGEPIPPAEITWITVPDTQIAAVAVKVPVGGVVLHASGAMGLEPLRHHSSPGSLHPLMTFPGPTTKIPIPQVVPAAISGNPTARAAATKLANLLGFTPFDVPGDRRLYHAAAVMVGNFTTVLMAEATRLLTAAGVKPEDAPALLAPLAVASIENAVRIGPKKALTGPVARNDQQVIASHQEAIGDSMPDLLPTYNALLAATQAMMLQND